ncbi:uncharacterized protein LOC113463942, partial [Ceratina calcarata]|uniref:Uncharacterized protein LOC113463942 n=1 Tax=Ceratina calcarata TaxID=156304 RepID=A0AAJ7W956_9HYME
VPPFLGTASLEYPDKLSEQQMGGLVGHIYNTSLPYPLQRKKIISYRLTAFTPGCSSTFGVGSNWTENKILVFARNFFESVWHLTWTSSGEKSFLIFSARTVAALVFFCLGISSIRPPVIDARGLIDSIPSSLRYNWTRCSWIRLRGRSHAGRGSRKTWSSYSCPAFRAELEGIGEGKRMRTWEQDEDAEAFL